MRKPLATVLSLADTEATNAGMDLEVNKISVVGSPGEFEPFGFAAVVITGIRRKADKQALADMGFKPCFGKPGQYMPAPAFNGSYFRRKEYASVFAARLRAEGYSAYSEARMD